MPIKVIIIRHDIFGEPAVCPICRKVECDCDELTMALMDGDQRDREIEATREQECAE